MTGATATQSSSPAEALAAAISRRTATFAVVGLGYIGSAVAQALTDAGFSVHGYDRAARAVDRFAAAGARRRHELLSLSTREDALADADVVHIAVTVPAQDRERPDLGPLTDVAASLRRYPRPARLVVLHSTVPPGTTRWLASQCAPLAGGTVFTAHCPERLQPGNEAWTLENTPHVVGGVDETSTRLALLVLERISRQVAPATGPEVTELAKLMENAFIAVGVALAGEITRMANHLGVSGTDVAEAAASKPFSYYGFFPGPGVGGHCIPNDLAILAGLRADLALDSPLIGAASTVLAEMPALVVERLVAVSAAVGVPLAGARVLLVGLGYKIGSHDITNTPAREVIRLLRSHEAVPVYLDSRQPGFSVDGEPVQRVEPTDLHPGGFDAALVLAGDSSVPGDALTTSCTLVIDAGGGRAMPGGLPRAERI